MRNFENFLIFLRNIKK